MYWKKSPNKNAPHSSQHNSNAHLPCPTLELLSATRQHPWTATSATSSPPQHPSPSSFSSPCPSSSESTSLDSVPLARCITEHPTGVTHLQSRSRPSSQCHLHGSTAIIEVKQRNAFNDHLKQISLFRLSFQYGIFSIADSSPWLPDRVLLQRGAYRDAVTFYFICVLGDLVGLCLELCVCEDCRGDNWEDVKQWAGLAVWGRFEQESPRQVLLASGCADLCQFRGVCDVCSLVQVLRRVEHVGGATSHEVEVESAVENESQQGLIKGGVRNGSMKSLVQGADE